MVAEPQADALTRRPAISRFGTPMARVLPMLIVALGSRVAHAESRLFVDLRYQTDAGLGACPNEETFRGMVERQLGYDPFRADSPQVIVARAEAAERGIRGFVRWYDDQGNSRGERDLASDDPDCAAFVKAMGFTLAVQIQLLSLETPAADAARPSSPARADAKSAEATTTTRPDPARRVADGPVDPGPPRHSNWRFLVGLGPSVGFGLAPRAVPEGRLFAGVGRGELGLELGAEASLWARHATASDQGFEQSLLASTFAACGFIEPWSGCVVNKLGVLRVRGFGVDMPRSPSGLVEQVGLRLSVHQRFGSHGLLLLRIEALAPLVSWDVTLNGKAVWRMPPVSLGLGGDLAALFQ